MIIFLKTAQGPEGGMDCLLGICVRYCESFALDSNSWAVSQEGRMCLESPPMNRGVGRPGTSANQSGRAMDKAWNLPAPAGVRSVNRP